MTKTVILMMVLSSLMIVSSMAAANPPDVVWKTPMPSENDRELFAYQARPSMMTVKEGERLAQNFIIKADAKNLFDRCTKENDRLIYTSGNDGSAYLEISMKSRSIGFYRGLDCYDGEYSIPDLPSHTVAPALAFRWLRRLDLLPKNPDEIIIAHVGGLSLGVGNEDGSTETYEKLRTVKIRRRVGGLPVVGSGERVVLHLGQAGRLMGLIYDWSDWKPRPVATSELRTMGSRNDLARERIEFIAGRAQSVTVLDARVVLFNDYGRGVIEPAVLVDASARYEQICQDGREQKTVEFIEPCDFLVPLLRKPVAQYPDSDESAGVPLPAEDDPRSPQHAKERSAMDDERDGELR